MRRCARFLLAAVLFAPVLVTVGPAVPAQAAPVVSLAGPPMGWNSWNRFGCNINETLIRGIADAIVANNLDDVGYRYVNIDDCWMASTRDAQGRLQANATRFPSGIRALADYVHARGLKLGIYSSAGTATCQGLPASLDHEVVDAQTFASWQIDYLKYDNCNNQGRPAVDRYRAMGDALRATGRPIVYSICNWGQESPWSWGADVGGSLWRTTGDISDSWSSVTSLLDQQAGLEPFARQGAYNDPDMLEVGNGGMTTTEYAAHFSLWALLAAPLLLGNDLRSMSMATLDIIRNADVIAVNQDWGGSQGRRVRDFGNTEVWAKPMSDGSVAVVLFNRGTAAATVDQRGRVGAGRLVVVQPAQPVDRRGLHQHRCGVGQRAEPRCRHVPHQPDRHPRRPAGRRHLPGGQPDLARQQQRLGVRPSATGPTANRPPATGARSRSTAPPTPTASGCTPIRRYTCGSVGPARSSPRASASTTRSPPPAACGSPCTATGGCSPPATSRPRAPVRRR